MAMGYTTRAHTQQGVQGTSRLLQRNRTSQLLPNNTTSISYLLCITCLPTVGGVIFIAYYIPHISRRMFIRVYIGYLVSVLFDFGGVNFFGLFLRDADISSLYSD